MATLLLLTAPSFAQSFRIVADLGDPEGREPHAGLADGPNGYLFGTTVAGGNAKGTIFKVQPGDAPITLHVFSGPSDGAYPEAGLVRGSDGDFYGTTRYGGSYNKGTIFKFDPATGKLTTLHMFSGGNGAEPRGDLVQARDGHFYGTTSAGGSASVGNVFRITSGGTFTALRSFTGGSDGRKPYGGLVQGGDGNLYGTTSSGGASGMGTLFRITLTGGFTTLVAFNGTNGANPMAGLMRANDGNFYGTTFGGGPGRQGVLFRLSATGTLTVIASFSGANGAAPQAEVIQASDGLLYGTTNLGGANGKGVVFRASLNGNLTVLRSLSTMDGARPDGPLNQAANGRIYGTTPAEGPTGAAGTFFEITTGGAFTRLYSFRGSPTAPYGDLRKGSDGRLYGTSNSGGASGYGSVFAVEPDSGDIELLHTFSMSDGANPNDGVWIGSDGSLYGSTLKGGSNNQGAVFKKAPKGAFTLLGSLTGLTTGYWPYAGLTQVSDGSLYGVAYTGGLGFGTIFKVSTTGGVTKLASFNGTNGHGPYARLIEGPDGRLYGTTASAGAVLAGNIFAFDPDTKTITSLFVFNGANGKTPYAGLIVGDDGRLYGTTYAGGSSGNGTVFAFDIARRQLTTLHHFSGANGSHPYGALFEAKDGRLYGTTYLGGAANKGTVFSVGKSGGFKLLHSFNGTDGKQPKAGLVQLGDGGLYGTTAVGGSANNGVIYRIAPGDTSSPEPSPEPSPDPEPSPSPDGTINVTAPNAAVEWGIGSRRAITWKHSMGSGSTVRVELSRNGGSTWEVIASSVTNGATAGAFYWTVSGAGTTNARIRVSSADGSIKDVNDKAFAIAAPYIRVTSGAAWNVSGSATVTWGSNLGVLEYVKVELSRDGGVTYATVLSSKTISDGSLTISSVPSTWRTTRARVRITWLDNSAVRDASDVSFVID
jgi:uncharacterized repeat protein (TIGR03803 family)